MVDYYKYIQSPEWKKKSREFIKIRKNRCQKCKSIYFLGSHHKNYRCLGKERLRDIIVLCWNCHQKHHNDVKGYRVNKDWKQKLHEIRRAYLINPKMVGQIRASKNKYRFENPE